jgi:hypothetical protein
LVAERREARPASESTNRSGDRFSSTGLRVGEALSGVCSRVYPTNAQIDKPLGVGWINDDDAPVRVSIDDTGVTEGQARPVRPC